MSILLVRVQMFKLQADDFSVTHKRANVLVYGNLFRPFFFIKKTHTHRSRPTDNTTYNTHTQQPGTHTTTRNTHSNQEHTAHRHPRIQLTQHSRTDLRSCTAGTYNPEYERRVQNFQRGGRPLLCQLCKKQSDCRHFNFAVESRRYSSGTTLSLNPFYNQKPI